MTIRNQYLTMHQRYIQALMHLPSVVNPDNMPYVNTYHSSRYTDHVREIILIDTWDHIREQYPRQAYLSAVAFHGLTIKEYHDAISMFNKVS